MTYSPRYLFSPHRGWIAEILNDNQKKVATLGVFRNVSIAAEAFAEFDPRDLDDRSDD